MGHVFPPHTSIFSCLCNFTKLPHPPSSTRCSYQQDKRAKSGNIAKNNVISEIRENRKGNCFHLLHTADGWSKTLDVVKWTEMCRDRIQLWVCLKVSGTVKRSERQSDSHNKLTQNISSLTNAFRPTNYHGQSNNGYLLRRESQLQLSSTFSSIREFFWDKEMIMNSGEVLPVSLHVTNFHTEVHTKYVWSDAMN